MKQRIAFLVKYFVFWVCAFLLAKLVFLLYQHVQSLSISPTTWFGIFANGLKLDLSMTAYISLLPALILLITSFSKPRPAHWVIINIYSLFMIMLFLLITLVDLEIYKFWGSRLDSGPMRFLNKPREVLASSSLVTLALYTVAFVGLSGFIFWLYKRYVVPLPEATGKSGIPGVIAFSIIIGLLFVTARGGLGVSPINTGSVYFSKNLFANHAAVNVMWNFGQSLLENKESHNPYVFNKHADYEATLVDLYKSGETTRVLASQKPNILLIILESFSAKIIEPLGGTREVTPRFNEISDQGILFSQIYSTDSRTDKGVATIISGYPVLEAIPIMKYPEKTQNLPFISRTLINNGYHCSFLYGGDVDFANMRSYLVNGGFHSITSQSDFPSSMVTGKWGVPDHKVFDRYMADIKADTGTWFKVMLTLTNHEPFEIPGKPKFGSKNLTDKFYSSAFYADSCLGDFINRFKETGLWDNTLIILIADHGTRLPEFDEIFEPGKHHIPMLWTGGAVAEDTVISKIGSQADLAYTLLRQLGYSTEGYLLGKDLLSEDSQSFAFYSIKNGIAMLTDSSGFGYDFISNDLNFAYGIIDTSHVDIAKSLQQFVFDDYLRLSAIK